MGGGTSGGMMGMGMGLGQMAGYYSGNNMAASLLAQSKFWFCRFFCLFFYTFGRMYTNHDTAESSVERWGRWTISTLIFFLWVDLLLFSLYVVVDYAILTSLNGFVIFFSLFFVLLLLHLYFGKFSNVYFRVITHNYWNVFFFSFLSSLSLPRRKRLFL